MSNPIRKEDIFEPGAIEDLKKELESIIDTSERLKKSIGESMMSFVDPLNKLNFNKTKDLKEFEKIAISVNKQIKVSNKLTDESVKAQAKLAKVNALQAKATKEAAKAQEQKIKTTRAEFKAEQDLEKAIKKEEAERAKAAKTAQRQAAEQAKLSSAYNQASARLNDLRKRYKDLAILGRENGKVARGLKQEIDQLDKTLKQVDASVGQFNRNVGNYKESVKEALAETELFNEGLNELGKNSNVIVQGLGRIITYLKKVKEAEEGAEKGAKSFSTALKLSGIGLVITALTSLYAAFTQNREGALKFDLLLGKIKATVDVLFGSLAKVGSGLLKLGDAFISFFSGDFSEAGKSVKEGFNEIGSSFDGFGERVSKNIKDTSELIKLQFEWADKLRILNRELQTTNLNLEDQQEIANDVTIGMEQRNKALEASFVLERKAANLREEIATEDLKFANKKLQIELTNAGISRDLSKEELIDLVKNGKLKNKVVEESLQKQQEAILALEQATDAVLDLNRQQGEAERKRLEKVLTIDIELLRSKKNSTKLLSEELQKQIDNERNTLDERELFAKQQIQNERAVTDAIIERIRETAIAEIKTNAELSPLEKEAAKNKINNLNKEALLREGNAILLENQIKNLGLSEQLTTDLAGAIKKAQEAEFKGQENLLKIEEERIKLKQRLIELENERQQIIEQQLIDEIQAQSNELINEQARIQEELLKGENAFNFKLIEERTAAHEKTLALLDAEYKERQRLLDLQFQADIAAVDNSTKSEEEKDAEKLNLQTKYNAESEKLNRELTDKTKEENKRQADFIEATTEQQIKIIAQQTDKLLGFIADASAKASEKRQEQLDKDIEARQQNIERQQALAERGLSNQLAFEKAQLAQQELIKQQEAEKEKRRQELIAFYRLLASYAESNPNEALGLALRDIALAKGAEVLFAATGAEAIKGPGTETSDSIPAMLSLNESVITAKGTKEAPGLATAWNNGMLGQWFEQNLLPNYIMDGGLLNGSTASNLSNSAMLNQLVSMNKRLQSLETTIANKKETMVRLDNLGNVIVSEVEKGIRVNTLHKRRKPRI